MYSQMHPHTPNRRLLPGSNSPVLERSLLVNQNRFIIRKSFLWGSLNLSLLSILLYDLSYSCPMYLSYFHYVEYIFVFILTFNLLYYIVRIMKSIIIVPDPIPITMEQKRLLGVKDSDPNYKLIVPSPRSSGSSPMTNCYSSTPMNLSALSWRSNMSQNDSMNFSMSSPSWSYVQGAPPPSISFSKTPPVSSFRDTSSVEFITDETSLNKYLQDHANTEKVQEASNKDRGSSNLLSSFWIHPVAKTTKDLTSFIKKCQYQLSMQSPITKLASGSPTGKADEKGSPSQMSALEIWTRINVDTVALTQWNENLRMWISQTILERLVNEFELINKSMEKHGLTDIKIGAVGLDRLRKTAQMIPVAQFAPSLATLIPFLEVTANQEYLEKRTRELAKGGCMSEFKWNAGGSFNGRPWDDSLPTDCAIIMHYFATYLDTQLMPLPNMPDTKAFSGLHFLKTTDKMPTLTLTSLFIQQVTEKPPHYRVIVGDKVYEMVKGYNNLFHSILFFIYHVNKMEDGMLGRVNLGRAGINILWVIDQ